MRLAASLEAHPNHGSLERVSWAIRQARKGCKLLGKPGEDVGYYLGKDEEKTRRDAQMSALSSLR